MMQKLQEMQKQIEESKKKLVDIKVEEEIEGKIKIKANANRVIENVEILDNSIDKEEMEDYLITVINRVIEKAGNIHDNEMASSARGMIPGM